jgi:ABC-2 type transport system permease protein
MASSALNGSPEYLQVYLDGKVAFWAGHCYLVAFADAIVCAMAVFSDQFNHRAALAIHALPIRREGLFLTNYLAGLVLMFAPLAVGLLGAILTEVAMGGLNLTLLLMWFTAQSMADLIFFSMAAFCAQLTGNLVAYPILYGGLQLVPWVVSQMITTVCSTLLRGFYSFPMMETAARWCSPIWNLAENVNTVWRKTGKYTQQYFLHGWKCLFCYLVISVVLAGVALAIYRRRQVETAGDVVAIPILRPVFRYFFTVVCAMTFAGVLSTLMFSSQLALWSWKHVVIFLFLLIVGGFLGYFSAQMMLLKTLRVFTKGWGGYGACMLAMVAVVCALKGDVFRFATWLPSADLVERVELVEWGVTLEGEDAIAQAVAFHAAVVSDLSGTQQQVQDYYTAVNSAEYDEDTATSYIDGIAEGQWYTNHDLCTVTMIYHMYGGTEYARAYTIYVDEDQLEDHTTPAYQLQMLMNKQEFSASRYQSLGSISLSQVTELNLYTYGISGEDNYMDDYVVLSDENAQQVVAAIQKDLGSSGSIRHNLLTKNNYSWSGMDITITETNLIRGDTYYDTTTATAYRGSDYTWYYLELNDSWAYTIQALTDLGVLDENHILANDEIVTSSSFVDSDEEYDEDLHCYVNSGSEVEMQNDVSESDAAQ